MHIPSSALLVGLILGCGQDPRLGNEWSADGADAKADSAGQRASPASDEVVYHVFVRSFYDTDRDRHGDLQGIIEKLDYVRELGATTLLISPVFESETYHNYFAASFDRIDPELGTREDLLELFAEAHARGLKVVMDMELQYVTTGHPWFDESYGNPESPFGSFVDYLDDENREPDTGYLGGRYDPSYDGRAIDVFTVNLREAEVRAAVGRVYQLWIDPDGDGDPADGVDGFRLDHMMDDLDDKGRITGLLSTFWRPLFDALRAVNPDLLLVGEPADWQYGEALMRDGDASGVHALPLAHGLRTLDKARIAHELATHAAHTPAGKRLFVSLENHDLDRYASIVGSDPSYLRMGAILTLFLPGTPVIYYGQEIGATGLRNHDWHHDGQEIPLREAMLWDDDPDAPGTATWYRGEDAPWWRAAYVRSGAYASVARQLDAADSLRNFYRSLIGLRARLESVRRGSLEVLDNTSPSVIAFRRSFAGEETVVLLNPAHEPHHFELDPEQIAPATEYVDALSGRALTLTASMRMEAKSFLVLTRSAPGSLR